VTVLSLTSWGWIVLIFSIVQLITGVGFFGGYLWARSTGIAVDALVTYALATMPNPASVAGDGARPFEQLFRGWTYQPPQASVSEAAAIRVVAAAPFLMGISCMSVRCECLRDG
jgi:hypothetical protein